MRMATMPTTLDLFPWPQDDAVSRQDILTPLSILTEFGTTEYSIHSRNFKDI